jgi:hypothetical protein
MKVSKMKMSLARQFTLAAFVLALILIAFLPAPPLQHPELVTQPFRIEGRWKNVRSALGLSPLPDLVLLPHTSPDSIHNPPLRAARFDLKTKRAAVEIKETASPTLFFAQDSLYEPSYTRGQLLQLLAADRAAEQARRTLMQAKRNQTTTSPNS